MLGPDECWLWQGGENRRFRYMGRSALAHHVAYELYLEQEIPSGVRLKHRCCNLLCCNGKHIYAPSWKPDAHNGRTRFSKPEIEAIRKERAAGVPLQDIREKWGANTRALLLMFRL